MEDETETLEEGTVKDGKLVEALHIVVVVFSDLAQTKKSCKGGDEAEGDVASAKVRVGVRRTTYVCYAQVPYYHFTLCNPA